MNKGSEIFRHPHVVYRIVWHIDDAATFRAAALSCRVAARAAHHWQRPKQTEFSREVERLCVKVLPNGEFHGPHNDAHPFCGHDPTNQYFIRGIASDFYEKQVTDDIRIAATGYEFEVSDLSGQSWVVLALCCKPSCKLFQYHRIYDGEMIQQGEDCHCFDIHNE